jgi:DNA modification methylase
MKNKTAGLTVVRKQLSDLKPHPQNPRVHPDGQLSKLESSLEAYSYTKGSIVVQKGTDTILAGHGVYEALKKQGYTEVDVIEADLPEGMAEAFMVADNKLGDDSLWDEELLNELLDEIADMPDIDIEMTGFGEDELQALLDGMRGNEVHEDNFNVDNALEEEPITQAGDLWLLGKHRVLCGDSTLKDDVDRVMGGRQAIVTLTDPPYSVGYEVQHRDPERKTKAEKGEAYQDPPASNVLQFISFLPSDVLVMTYPVNKHFQELASATTAWRMLYECVWVKHHFAFIIGRNYQPKHESILIFRRKKYRNSVFNVPANVSTVFEYDKGAANKEHPTARPLGLWLELLTYQSNINSTIYDPFLGSGTTLIAADQLDRICYGLEIEPRYCDVIVKRYINHVGHSAGVFVERDGKRLTWDELQ